MLGTVSDLLENGEGDMWREKAEQVRKKIHDYLWIDDKKACFDRDCDNQFMDILTHNNLRCMYYGSFSQEMADDFIRYHLLNPEEFWTPVPLPSIAANDPAFRNINFNNWGGQPQGLTYQRAIQALEKYDHVAEIRMLGKIWLKLLSDTNTLRQQYDPFTGAPCVTRSEGLQPEGEETERYKDVVTLGPDGYGPTVLSALEYISLMYGVNISCDTVKWSCIKNTETVDYMQFMYEKKFSLQSNEDTFTASIDGKPVFTCSKGVQITTDLCGNILSVAGIETTPCNITLSCSGTDYTGTISPNEFMEIRNTDLVSVRKMPFDYPFSL